MAEPVTVQRYFCQGCATSLGIDFSSKIQDIESARCSQCHQGRLCNLYDVTHVEPA